MHYGANHPKKHHRLSHDPNFMSKAQLAGAAAARDQMDRCALQHLEGEIQSLVCFINEFSVSARAKWASVNERLTSLERTVDYLEACTWSAQMEPGPGSGAPPE